MTRVGIVNDVALVAEALRRIVSATPGFTIAWIAKDGLEAVAKARADRPDMILMDLVMPVMDGVESTRRIMREAPCAILVVTATVTGNLSMVFEALGHGALDAVQTPGFSRGGTDDGTVEFRRKLLSVARLVSVPGAPRRPGGERLPATVPAATAPGAGRAEHLLPLVLIGASTGGPQALVTVLEGMKATPGAAVLIVQHLDARFADSFVAWLGQRSPMPVVAARPGDRPRPGVVAIAVGEEHLRLDGLGAFAFSREPVTATIRPSADVLFESVAARAGANGVAAILTGMGRDGARGMLALRRTGFHTLAQDAGTSVIHGMPSAAAAAGGVMEMLPIERIGPRIAELLRGRSR